MLVQAIWLRGSNGSESHWYETSLEPRVGDFLQLDTVEIGVITARLFTRTEDGTHLSVYVHTVSPEDFRIHIQRIPQHA
jgi:hypothetical protein